MGCNIPARVKQYETASREVLSHLGVQLADVREFNCCGYPMRNTDEKAFLFSAAVNLALAEQADLDILALCKCCFGSLREAAHMLSKEGPLQEEVHRLLGERGLEYKGTKEIRHFLWVLFHDVGLAALKTQVKERYADVGIATHYGCHALRPSRITDFDDPVAPSLFDRLVEATGARSVEWERQTECCGAPVLGINDNLSMNLTQKKLNAGRRAGADYLCTACPFCHMQFDAVQQQMVADSGKAPLPPILYPQLLGLCMGLDEESLGIQKNRLDISGITSFINREPSNVE